ncbi:Hypothetical predicted protein [Octopus vulgaris]|uniref:Uncharacterized protein n=1 Tax=Octopus vulgaris TaxID=6645 RepID=A0AA36BCL2_OCTVU|nr:Hypothetical predicted protein [Octopus vulgaris]
MHKKDSTSSSDGSEDGIEFICIGREERGVRSTVVGHHCRIEFACGVDKSFLVSEVTVVVVSTLKIKAGIGDGHSEACIIDEKKTLMKTH